MADIVGMKDTKMKGSLTAPIAGIDLFQRLVAIGRSSDKTMAALSQWVIDHQDRVVALTISGLASETGVSETTVFRFCKLLGLNGYKDLRFALVESQGMALGTQLLNPNLPDSNPFALIMQKVVQTNSEQLAKTMNLVSLSALQSATDLIAGADHIHLVGFGSSAPVVFDFYQRLLCLGITASAHSDPHVLAAVTANARPGAVFFGVSCSGRARDTFEAFETAGSRGFKRISITSDAESPLTRVSDVVLISAVRRSPISLDVIGTRISQLAIVEIICVALAVNSKSGTGDAQLLEREIAKKRTS